MNVDLGRSRSVTALTLVVGAVVLAWSLSIPPGDTAFYPATAVLAAVWVVGALLARPGWPGAAQPGASARSTAREAVTGVAVGAGLAVVFCVGALVVSALPALREPVRHLLDHAHEGIVPVVLALTLVNGFAEELFFRGALYDALDSHRPVLWSTVVYTVVTAASGIPLLALAGLVLGTVAAWLRSRTGHILAPVLTHLTWSVGMFFLLPRLLDTWS